MGSLVEEKSSIPLTALRWCFNTLIHQIIFAIFVFIVWTVSYYTSGAIFWHALLCTIAYIPLMAEAILLFSEDTAWSTNLTRRQKMWIHGITLGGSAILTLVGIVIEIVSRNNSGKTHFGSPHSICGLISLCLCLAGIIGGLAAANINTFKAIISPNWIKIGHICMSLLGYATGIAAIYFAFDKKSIALWTTQEQQTAGKIVTVIMGVYTLISPLKSLYSKVATLLK